MTKGNDTYPRYVAVYDELQRDILAGAYLPGEKLPGENELAKHFSVSRNTLRQAIMLLHEDGYVYMRQGKGTFVLRNQTPRQETLTSLANPLVTLATEEIDRVETRLEIREISPKNQAIFGLDASKLLALVETVCHSGANRLGCGLSFLPYDALSAAGVPLNDMERVAAFYNQLLVTDGLMAQSSLRIVSPREPVTLLLGVTSQQQLIMLDETVRDNNGGVVMTQKLFFIPSAYEFTIIRKNERINKK